MSRDPEEDRGAVAPTKPDSTTAGHGNSITLFAPSHPSSIYLLGLPLYKLRTLTT